jgi:pantoate--beta-alanine ligase
MFTATTIEAMRRERAALRGRVALVPTMGALHEGHRALLRAGREAADHLLVSIFVNPTQFAPNEDYAQYPRDPAGDLAMCRAEGATGVFHPNAEHMYPPEQPGTRIDVPALTESLEGADRPGHFAGVCRIVAKLLEIVRPDLACFGKKDYQQLRVIEAMTADLHMPVEILPCPIVRETDGLAVSSRNQYLNAAQRQRALGLRRALDAAHRAVQEEGTTDPAAVEAVMRRAMKESGVAVDYAAVRDARWLQPIDALPDEHALALLAGRVDEIRLIDNAALNGVATA